MNQATTERPASHNPFLWGVASSAFQHEGSYNEPGRPLNNWFTWEKTGRVDRTGRSVDFWNRYPEDFRIAREMGLNAFRLGIEWARVQPVTEEVRGEPPPFSAEALDHYARMMVSARKNGLDPLVTLVHFTTPYWLGPDPLLNRKLPELFERFVVTAVAHVNAALVREGCAPLKRFLTFNEPNMLILNTYLATGFPGRAAPGFETVFQAYMNLIEAHLRAYRALHALYESNPGWGEAMVSLNTYVSDLFWTDRGLVDLLAAPGLGVTRSEAFPWLHDRYRAFGSEMAHASRFHRKGILYWISSLIRIPHHWFGTRFLTEKRMNGILDMLFDQPRRALDFVAIDYYEPFSGHGLHWPGEVSQRGLTWMGRIGQALMRKAWDWHVIPEAMDLFCRVYHRAFPNFDILIAENGMAYHRPSFLSRARREDRVSRSEYLRLHLAVVDALREEGIPLRGYYHWSLTDNYEWGSFAARFGLFHVDIGSDELRREVRDDMGDEPSKTFRLLIEASRQKWGEHLSSVRAA